MSNENQQQQQNTPENKPAPANPQQNQGDNKPGTEKPAQQK